MRDDWRVFLSERFICRGSNESGVFLEDPPFLSVGRFTLSDFDLFIIYHKRTEILV